MSKKIVGNTTTTPIAPPDWNQTDETKADYIKNKPSINGVELSGDLEINIPEKISELNNDSNFVSDDEYVHTDNNFTDEYKEKLDNLGENTGGSGSRGITHSWNGTVLTIISDSGTSSVDLKGDKGDPPNVEFHYDEETGNLYYKVDGTLVDGEYVATNNLVSKEYLDNCVDDAVNDKITTPTTAEIGQTIAVKEIDENGKPISWEAIDLPDSGGGTGTTDYEDLDNKPSINGVELSGNVELAIPKKTSELNNDSNFVSDKDYVHTDNNFTNAYKNKLDNLDADAGGGSSSGSGTGGSGSVNGSFWLQPFELMGTATLQEDCTRWIITQTDDGVTFDDKKYRAIKFITKTTPSADTTASSANGYVWINQTWGTASLTVSNMLHSNATRTQTLYGEVANGYAFYTQLNNNARKLVDIAKVTNTHIDKLILDVATSGHKYGAGSTVEIWGCK